MTETRLLARLLATARTVTALGAVSPVRSAAADDGAETVRAQVTAQLADGSFRVLIDGAAHRVELPPHVRPGDVIELRLLPRQAAARQPQPGGSDGGELSPTGRLIAALLSTAAPEPQRQARPVLDMPPTAPADLPEPLARALESSGMFYESHQARWMEGDYPLERLLQEPQAALLPRPQADEPETQPAPRLPAPIGADGPAEEVLPATEDLDPSSQLALARSADAEKEGPVAREALPIVRGQLEALETRHVAWLGEIWPGQLLQWEIDADDESERRDGEEPNWSTRFSLALPALGEIEASAAIGSSGVRLELGASAPDAVARLRSALPELLQALAGAGVEVVHAHVRRHEPAD